MNQPIHFSHKKNFISPIVHNSDSEPNPEPNSDYIQKQIDILTRQAQSNRGTRKNISNHIPVQYNEQIYSDQLLPKIYNKSSNFIGDSDEVSHVSQVSQSQDPAQDLSQIPIDMGGETSSTYTGKIQYNPYLDWLEHNGTKKSHDKTRYETYYINIDSSSRVSTPIISTGNPVLLETDPCTFSSTTSHNDINYLLNINIPNHNFKINDRITITGITTPETILRTVYTDSSNLTQYNVIFTPGSNWVKILCPPNMSFGNYFLLNLPNQIIVNKYNMTNTFVTISGFQGYPSSTYIGNIPLNTLNTTHQIYLKSTPLEVNDLTYFYIYLTSQFVGSINPQGYNIFLKYEHIGGIPLNLLNAEFPINSNYAQGYQTISNITTNTISIVLPVQGILGVPFGGSDIYVSLLTNVNTGDANPNSYIINLNKTYYNVVMVSLISSIFPKTQNVFRTTNVFVNTKLYWQNSDDGDIIYSVQITDGNYDIPNLIIELESKINACVRTINSTSTYKPINNMSIQINPYNNIASFSSYNTIDLTKPIINILPNPTLPQTTGTYTLTISNPNHNLLIGSTIKYTGMISTQGLDENILNQTHVISDIIDTNTYQIILYKVNLMSNLVPIINGGGYNVTAYIPNSFRLLFSYPDTMGNELGFRNVGLPNSITGYNTTITNADTYFNELPLDSVGNTIKLKNNNINLNGDEYIIMSCLEANNLVHYNKYNISNVFAKIHLTKYNEKQIDNFVSTPVYFYEPTNINKLTMGFYSPTTGNLYDFENNDHSYVLQIVTLLETLQETGIFSKTGREY